MSRASMGLRLLVACGYLFIYLLPSAAETTPEATTSASPSTIEAGWFVGGAQLFLIACICIIPSQVHHFSLKVMQLFTTGSLFLVTVFVLLRQYNAESSIPCKLQPLLLLAGMSLLAAIWLLRAILLYIRLGISRRDNFQFAKRGRYCLFIGLPLSTLIPVALVVILWIFRKNRCVYAPSDQIAWGTLIQLIGHTAVAITIVLWMQSNSNDHAFAIAASSTMAISVVIDFMVLLLIHTWNRSWICGGCREDSNKNQRNDMRISFSEGIEVNLDLSEHDKLDSLRRKKTCKPALNDAFSSLEWDDQSLSYPPRFPSIDQLMAITSLSEARECSTHNSTRIQPISEIGSSSKSSFGNETASIDAAPLLKYQATKWSLGLSFTPIQEQSMTTVVNHSLSSVSNQDGEALDFFPRRRTISYASYLAKPSLLVGQRGRCQSLNSSCLSKLRGNCMPSSCVTPSATASQGFQFPMARFRRGSSTSSSPRQLSRPNAEYEAILSALAMRIRSSTISTTSMAWYTHKFATSHNKTKRDTFSVGSTKVINGRGVYPRLKSVANNPKKRSSSTSNVPDPNKGQRRSQQRTSLRKSKSPLSREDSPYTVIVPAIPVKLKANKARVNSIVQPISSTSVFDLAYAWTNTAAAPQLKQSKHNALAEDSRSVSSAGTSQNELNSANNNRACYWVNTNCLKERGNVRSLRRCSSLSTSNLCKTGITASRINQNKVADSSTLKAWMPSSKQTWSLAGAHVIASSESTSSPSTETAGIQVLPYERYRESNHSIASRIPRLVHRNLEEAHENKFKEAEGNNSSIASADNPSNGDSVPLPLSELSIPRSRRYALSLRSAQRPRKHPFSEDQLEMLDMIAKGPNSIVYKARLHDNHWQRWVVVKFASNPSVGEDMIKAEATILRQLDHPNIVQLIGTVSTSPSMIVFEYMKQGSLDKVLQTESLKHMKLMQWAINVVAAVDYLHGIGIIHRDIASRNVLLHGNVAKLGDFGFSKYLPDGVTHLNEAQAAIPVRWACPEALNYGIYSRKNDIWSFGVLLYELFSRGKIPYHGWRNIMVVTHVALGHRLSPIKGCPKTLYRLMLECWHPSAKERPSSHVLKFKLMELAFNSDAMHDVYISDTDEIQHMYRQDKALATSWMVKDKPCLLVPSEISSILTSYDEFESEHTNKDNARRQTICATDAAVLATTGIHERGQALSLCSIRLQGSTTAPDEALPPI
eukprot:gene3143-5890_t